MPDSLPATPPSPSNASPRWQPGHAVLGDAYVHWLQPTLLPEPVLVAYSPQAAQPWAAVYSGHQLDVWAGQLRDSRAITLGALADAQGVPQEIQLKGSGRTPYSCVPCCAPRSANFWPLKPCTRWECPPCGR